MQQATAASSTKRSIFELKLGTSMNGDLLVAPYILYNDP